MVKSSQTKRPVVIIGGWLSASRDYQQMATVLARPPYNRVVYITDISRREWGEVRDPDFRLVINILARTIAVALAETGAEKVDLIGHSSGGRVARTYLGDKPYYQQVYNGFRSVASLTTLGTSHATWETFVRKFGAFVEQTYPGAYFPQIAYRSVAGDGVRGRRLGRPEEMFAYHCYELITGNGSDIGDGVTPTRSCYLTGADQLVLPGVRHIPHAPQWYGAPDVIGKWFPAE